MTIRVVGGVRSAYPMIDIDRLIASLSAYPDATAYRVALSGGLDSTVLLHLLARSRDRLSAPVSAIHIHHGLLPEADAWAAHCACLCADRDVPIDIVRVEVKVGAQGPEAAAREARYGAFADRLGPGEVLLTAHHRDDQAETLLLRLVRGAGVHGLAGMPPTRTLGNGTLLRPLLHVPRTELHRYAVAEGLSWVDDPSNAETSFERNFIRHEVMPLLERRRPGVATVLAHTAARLAASAGLLDALAEEDARAAAGSLPETLSVRALLAMAPERADNLLHWWLRRAGVPMPSAEQLTRIRTEVAAARDDAEPRLDWPGGEVRRYRDDLYATPPLSSLPREPIAWDGSHELVLPDGLGVVALVDTVGEGIAAHRLVGGALTIGWRHGGERFHPRGRSGSHPLKKLFQEAGIPPWERERTPLLHIDGELAAVPAVGTAGTFAAGPDEPGFRLVWWRTGL